jgi:hypothetical protein
MSCVCKCLQEEDEEEISRLSVFLDASPMEEENPDLNINVLLEIAAENKDPAQTKALGPLFHGFCRESDDWGFRKLVCAADHTLRHTLPRAFRVACTAVRQTLSSVGA